MADGYTVALIAVPDNISYEQTDKVLDAGFIRVMCEKPASTNSELLTKLIQKAEAKGVTCYINYQRTFDDRIQKLLKQV